MITARLTQDCLENLFSVVRTRNPVPTPVAFKNALKIIAVSQFFKISSSNESYLKDDRCFIGDFLGPKNSAVTEGVVDIELTDVAEVDDLDDAERTSLFYIAGYCIRSVEKNEVVCDECLSAIKQINIREEAKEEMISHEGHHSLTNLKEYKSGCLTKATDPVFAMILSVEMMIRRISEEKMLSLKNAKKQLLDEAKSLVADVDLPSCHDVKVKLLAKYINTRLAIFCRRANAKRKTKEIPRGSRSMAMRGLVKSVK